MLIYRLLCDINNFIQNNMKKTLLFLCLLYAMRFFAAAGNVVPLNDARTVGANFLAINCQEISVQPSDLTLTHVEKSVGEIPLYYVFSIRQGGFIIMAADDAVAPVLAFSLENDYASSIPNYLLQKYSAQVAAAKNVEEQSAVREWNYYREVVPTRDTYVAASVGPLMTSEFNQAPYYNNYCPVQNPSPYGSTNNQYHVPTGCVATAMAGLLHYYRYPVFGTGHATYQPTYVVRDGDNNPTDTIIYPIQDQDFNVEHNYEMMPDAISEHTGEVAELMWHAGLSIEIAYGPTSTSGYSADAVNAFKNVWGYNPSAQYVSRSNYTPANWFEMIHNELDAHRIVFYSARETSDPTVGHAFLLDGYRDYNQVLPNVVYADTVYVFDHVDTNAIYTYIIDSVTLDTLDTQIDYEMDSVFTIFHSDSVVTLDTLFSHTMIHVNWGWGGYLNGYFTFENSHVEGWSVNESAAIELYPAGNPEEPTEGNVRVRGTRGTISDGAGNRLYSPNTDRSWMVSAPEATRYRFMFRRLATEENADEIIFYKNGDLNQEVCRFSGHTVSSSPITINADSVMIRFVTNDNDVVDYGFVIEFQTIIPGSYCNETTTLTGAGTITDKGDYIEENTNSYRPDSYCTWKIVGCHRVYFSYPQIDLAAGDYIEFYDVTSPAHRELLKRISLLDWPEEDVFVVERPKINVVFVSDNYLENNGFTLTYEIETDINDYAELNELSVYPNPADNVLNVDLTSEFEGDIQFGIVDLSGRILSQETVHVSAGELHHSFNISALAKGIYLLNIVTPQGKTVRKFVVS